MTEGLSSIAPYRNREAENTGFVLCCLLHIICWKSTRASEIDNAMFLSLSVDCSFLAEASYLVERQRPFEGFATNVPTKQCTSHTKNRREKKSAKPRQKPGNCLEIEATDKKIKDYMLEPARIFENVYLLGCPKETR